MTIVDPVPPLVFTPHASLGAAPEGQWWLTSVELWPKRVVIRAHILGYAPIPGQPHAGGGLFWRVKADHEDLTLISTLAGGLGAGSRVEWVFESQDLLEPNVGLDIAWSGPGLQGSLRVP